MFSKSLIVAGMGIAVALAQNPVSAQEAPVKVGYTHKKGDVVKLRMTINASVGGMDIVVKITNKDEVTEVKDNGNVVTVQTPEATIVNIGGMDMEQPGGAKVTATRDKYGKLVELKAPEEAGAFMSPEVQKFQASITDILMPEKPVKAGDSWTTELDNPMVKGKKFSVKTTFVGIEKLEGKEYWKVKQTATADSDAAGAKTTVEFTAMLEPATGTIFSAEGTVKDLPTLQAGAISWKMKVEQVKAAAK